MKTIHIFGPIHSADRWWMSADAITSDDPAIGRHMASATVTTFIEWTPQQAASVQAELVDAVTRFARWQNDEVQVLEVDE